MDQLHNEKQAVNLNDSMPLSLSLSFNKYLNHIYLSLTDLECYWIELFKKF